MYGPSFEILTLRTCPAFKSAKVKSLPDASFKDQSTESSSSSKRSEAMLYVYIALAFAVSLNILLEATFTEPITKDFSFVINALSYLPLLSVSTNLYDTSPGVYVILVEKSFTKFL